MLFVENLKENNCIDLSCFLCSFRIWKVDQIIFIIFKVKWMATVAMKMNKDLFIQNEKVNFYHHYMVYHMHLFKDVMRIK